MRAEIDELIGQDEQSLSMSQVDQTEKNKSTYENI